MKKIHKKIKIKGIVQGVGFRPFVYRLAIKYALLGWVNNTSEGVVIDIEGFIDDIESFLSDIYSQAPPLAKINELEIKELPLKGYNNFDIRKSREGSSFLALISPDIATCSQCKQEINNKSNRRYQYPFTNCTNCGPRYSIIEDLPYDRSVTSMKSFQMCDKCRKEYENPFNRRYHAQPNACPECGPKIWLTDNLGSKLDVKDPLDEVKNLLKKGKIVAVKGLGGFHLVCDALNQTAVRVLRKRKRRPDKPFALMMKNETVVKNYCYLSVNEKKVLTGIKKPILLLKQKCDHKLYDISPDNNYLGVMLPYTPLHDLLFSDGLNILVMTSANISGLPLEFTDQGALERLNKVADYFLLHNREIKVPVDDSISKMILGKEQLIRRGRGYAPLVINFEGLKDTLACGSYLKNTIAMSKSDYIFLSQHLGNISSLESYQHYKNAINHFSKIYRINYQIIAHDYHSGYLTFQYAKTQQGKKVKIQHHHAHIVSCMIDNEINRKVLGLAFDGTGIGTDGKIWGGEFLICSYSDFKRVGQLNYIKMPGGEEAIKEPWRMAVSCLFHSYGDDQKLINKIVDIDEDRIEKIVQLIKNDINCPQTSSMGRLFDTVASLIGLCNFISYEAQAAIKLESKANSKLKDYYNYQIKNEDNYFTVNTVPLIRGLVNDIKSGISRDIVAGKFHNTVISFSVTMCELIRDKYNINNIALSGGVFQNEIILKGIYNHLREREFEVYIHSRIPCNDGGIAVGQLVIANYMNRKK